MEVKLLGMDLLTTIIIFIAATGLIKILLALTILRFGIGLRDWASGVLVLAVSLLLVIGANSEKVKQSGGISHWMASFSDPVQAETHLIAHLDAMLPASDSTDGADQKKARADIGSAAYQALLVDLQTALKLGLLFILPFALLDILVAITLGALGITNLSVYALSFPLKLLLFLVLDGWNLVFSRLTAL